MSNQKNRNRGQNRFPREMQKKDSSRKKKNKAAISGFSTLNQVAGVPYIREHHSNISVLPVKSVNEPNLICPRCNKKIDTIASALTSPSGDYIHFDCALEEIKSEEKPRDGQVVSYIGSGNFGLCEKDESGKWAILKTIQYESSDKNKQIKEYVEGLKS